MLLEARLAQLQPKSDFSYLTYSIFNLKFICFFPLSTKLDQEPVYLDRSVWTTNMTVMQREQTLLFLTRLL